LPSGCANQIRIEGLPAGHSALFYHIFCAGVA
jgi:hypothetical protein